MWVAKQSHSVFWSPIRDEIWVVLDEKYPYMSLKGLQNTLATFLLLIFRPYRACMPRFGIGEPFQLILS